MVTGTLADAGRPAWPQRADAPGLIIVGEVVRLRETLDWFAAQPKLARASLGCGSRQRRSARRSLADSTRLAALAPARAARRRTPPPRRAR